MGKCKVLPRHVLLAVKNDTELDTLLKGVILDGGGVKPKIEPEMLKDVGEEEWNAYDITDTIHLWNILDLYVLHGFTLFSISILYLLSINFRYYDWSWLDGCPDPVFIKLLSLMK